MEEFRYPLVSELVYRAQNHNISMLTVTPIGQLWRIDPVDPGALLSQLENIIQSQQLTNAERLKLGFLTAYSWPLHYHPKTHKLLAVAKALINRSDTKESLLFWSVLAAFYMRNNQVMQALSYLTAAFEWAARNASLTDLFPLLHWAVLCLSRLHRQQEALHICDYALSIAKQVEDPCRMQTFSYARAHTLMRMGNYADSSEPYEVLLAHITAGTALFERPNQVGAVTGLAKIAIEKKQLQRAESLLGLARELSIDTSENILVARGIVLQCEFDLANNNIKSAHENFEAHLAHRDSNAFELDLPLEMQAQQLQHKLQLNVKQPFKLTTQPVLQDLELAIHQLRQSFHHCISALANCKNAPSPQLLH